MKIDVLDLNNEDLENIFCLFWRVTRSEKPSLSNQNQITFSKDEFLQNSVNFMRKRE